MTDDREEQRLIAQWNRRDRIASIVANGIGLTIAALVFVAAFVILANSVQSCSRCIDRGGRPVQGMMGQWECVP